MKNPAILKCVILTVIIAITATSSSIICKFTAKGSFFSPYWSGYVSTNGKYYAASARWIEPGVAPVGENYLSEVAIWVGIEGNCFKTRCEEVIQIGTEGYGILVDPAPLQEHNAWYELYPKPPRLIKGFKIKAGDVIASSIRLISGKSKNQIWKFTLTNITSGQKWNKVFRVNSSQNYANWIVESASWGIRPLANFGLITFQSIDANNGNIPISAVKDIMIHPKGQTANPSAINPRTGGFNVCWGNDKALTPCQNP